MRISMAHGRYAVLSLAFLGCFAFYAHEVMVGRQDEMLPMFVCLGLALYCAPLPARRRRARIIMHPRAYRRSA